jgi:hypothetical protein
MNKELNLILNKIKNKQPFALIRFGDGEKNIINNIECNRKGFSYDPGDIRDSEFRYNLIKSLEYNGGKNYFVGLNDSKLEKEVKGTIISPMIFVNQNYIDFLKKITPLFNDCILIANKKGNIDKLPFKPLDVIKIEDKFWHNTESESLHIGLLYWLYDKSTQIILVAGGAWSNVLIHRLWQSNKNHIYIDIGSTLDPFLFGKKTRKYQERLENDS